MSAPEPTPPIENLRSNPKERADGKSFDPTKKATDAVNAGNTVLKKCEGLCRKAEVKDKYGPEAIRADIQFQSALIRAWAKEMGFVEGKDYRIIASITDVVGDKASVAPHELKQFFVAIHENKYGQFREYFTDRYRDEMRQHDSKNDARLLYSWGGRFLVGWAGVPFDTAPASSIEKMTASTHHEEFKKFFKEETGIDFPTAQTLNLQLKRMAEQGLPSYQEALTKLRDMKEKESLPSDGYGLIDALVHATELLAQATTGHVAEELPELLRGNMPREMRTYADLTYNAGSIQNLDRVTEITGVTIPNEARIDKIFDRIGFDRNKMEEICKAFSAFIFANK